MVKRIPLGQGLEALIDDQDEPLLASWNWTFLREKLRGRALYYVRGHKRMGGGKRKFVPLHRLIMGAVAGQEVDHINGDGLDNRRANLRVCTHAENQRNQHSRLGGTSQYRGVNFHKDSGKWAAKIRNNGSQIHLGIFTTQEDAAHAYDLAAKKYHKEFANLNFPMLRAATGEGRG